MTATATEAQLLNWLHTPAQVREHDPDFDPTWLARHGADFGVTRQLGGPPRTRALEIAYLESLMALPDPKGHRLVGRHHFVAYEGDIELQVDERTGLLAPANPVLYATPITRNLIVDGGKTAYLDQLAQITSTGFNKVGVGTDSTAAAGGQIKLNPSVAGSVLIQACDATFPSRASNVLTLKSTFGTGVANFTWNEAGNFDGTVNGTSRMFNRVIIGPFAKTSAASIAYTNTITQS